MRDNNPVVPPAGRWGRCREGWVGVLGVVICRYQRREGRGGASRYDNHAFPVTVEEFLRLETLRKGRMNLLGCCFAGAVPSLFFPLVVGNFFFRQLEIILILANFQRCQLKIFHT